MWREYVNPRRWPCDDGFHIPTKDEWTDIYNAWISDWAWASDWWSNMMSYLKLPNAWYRDFWNSSWVYWWWRPYNWNYWTCTAYWTAQAYNLLIYSWWIYISYSNWAPRRTNWNSIRPFADEPVTPDSSWTAIYSDKIYHNSTLWLISVKNWSSRITIADKNLWATTVWNSWDGQTEAKCWKLYQRWNNYWFPLGWNVSYTLNTKIDASLYWPNNYYSSSTFVACSTTPYTWDSSNNTNLRWWEEA